MESSNKVFLWSRVSEGFHVFCYELNDAVKDSSLVTRCELRVATFKVRFLLLPSCSLSKLSGHRVRGMSQW